MNKIKELLGIERGPVNWETDGMLKVFSEEQDRLNGEYSFLLSQVIEALTLADVETLEKFPQIERAVKHCKHLKELSKRNLIKEIDL